MQASKEIQTIRRRASPIFRRYGVRKAAVFGSFARGEQRKKSDVDVLIEPPSTMWLLAPIGLEQDLEECLKRQVDVITYSGLHRRIRDRVLSEQVVIYEKRS
ncbi:MAG: nucleotidyltransferase family protein [Patescibacteria group bacterium]